MVNFDEVAGLTRAVYIAESVTHASVDRKARVRVLWQFSLLSFYGLQDVAAKLSCTDQEK